LESVEIITSITHNVLNLIATEEDALSFLELSRHVKHLEANGEDAYSYRVIQWKRAGHLIITSVLLLIGPFFVGANTRARQPSFWVFNGVLVGVSIYFLTRLIELVGTLERVPPAIYTFIPSLLVVTAIAALVKIRS